MASEPFVFKLFYAAYAESIDVREAQERCGENAGWIGATGFLIEANARQIEGLDARGFFGFDPAFDICEAVAVSEAMGEMFEV